MKKILLGTTALMAVGMLSGEASAQSKAQPIQLTVGGRIDAAIGYILDDDSGAGQAGEHHRAFSQKEDIRLNFRGDTKLDNGLTAGVFIQLRGVNTPAPITTSGSTQPGATSVSNLNSTGDVFGFFKGGFGELRFGDILGDARSIQQYRAPYAGYLFGTNTPAFSFSNNPIGTNSTVLSPLSQSRTTELVYFTPSFSGFQFALSYSPENGRGQRTANNSQIYYANGAAGNTPFDNDQNQFSQIASASGNYTGKIGAFDIGVSAGYTHADKEAKTAGNKSSGQGYQGGLNVTYGPITVGGTYVQFEDVNGANATLGGMGDTRIFDVGAMYTTGPFAVSLGWSRGEYEKLFAVSTSATGGTQTLDVVTLVGNYLIGPGLNLSAAIDFENYGSGVAASAIPASGVSTIDNIRTRDYSSTSIMVGTSIRF